MRTASWLLLAVVGALTLFGSLASVYVAYATTRDELGEGGHTLDDVAAGRADMATAIRGRRATAAAFAASYSVLFLFVVLGSYRRGDVWSWWAILTAALVLAVLVALRIPFLGTRLGAGAGATHFTAVAVALLLDVRRLWATPTARP